MIYAVPYQNGKAASHTMQAPQFLIVNSETRQSVIIETPGKQEKPGRQPACQQGRTVRQALSQHGVSALIVRHIGEKMLAAVRKAGMRVYHMPRGGSPDNLFPETLTEVTRSDHKRGSNRQPGHCTAPCTCHGAVNHKNESCCGNPRASSLALSNGKVFTYINRVISLKGGQQ